MFLELVSFTSWLLFQCFCCGNGRYYDNNLTPPPSPQKIAECDTYEYPDKPVKNIIEEWEVVEHEE